MKIQAYKDSYFKEVKTLFYECVHTINAKDYDKQQLDAWTNGLNEEKMQHTLLHTHTYVVMKDAQIVGFSNIEESGHLDMLYVHKDVQGQGVGTLLCDQLESIVASTTITTDASITAKSFFEKRGYQVIQKQEVVRQEIKMINYKMEKKNLCKTKEVYG